MNIYAIRDRLIDYYMQPFMGPSDKEVLAAVAVSVNNPDSKEPIHHAPHHFEIWRLGKIDQETGEVVRDRELLADAASLVRGSDGENAESPTSEIHPPLGGSQRPSRRTSGNT